jgi:hypothetical protein
MSNVVDPGEGSEDMTREIQLGVLDASVARERGGNLKGMRATANRSSYFTCHGETAFS